MLEQSVPEVLYPVAGTHAGAGHEELQAVGRTHVGEVHRGLSSMGRLHAGGGAECEESSPEEVGVAETTCDELTAIPIPCPPAVVGRCV